jgi:glutamine synthetase
MMSKKLLLEAIKEHDAKFIDLRFTNIQGKEQHYTIPVSAADDDFIENGRMIDGSSFKGWQKIHQSDLALMPDLDTIKLDPFLQDNTLFIRCNVVDPQTMIGYERCPRSLAQRAEVYLQSTGIADGVNFGPEPEFFLFDNVQWETGISGSFYKVDSDEAQWNSGKKMEGGNIGHRPLIKGGYFPVPPVDSSQDIRSAMCLTLESLGTVVEAHHHEVATANQCEVATRFNTLTKKADELQILKYVIHNVAHNYGKTATFMPKPLVGDNGSGMHCHQSLVKDDINLFSGDQYAGLSETALYYIGGIVKHARALNAFTNPSTNSYKRLVPGFEAPVLLAYSARNRSAAIRIPHVHNPKARRIEVRFPDPTANPYLAFSAMMMAGLDGIQNKEVPVGPMDEDLYELSLSEIRERGIPQMPHTLRGALESLIRDNDFLKPVFTQEFIDSYQEYRFERDVFPDEGRPTAYEFKTTYQC